MRKHRSISDRKFLKRARKIDVNEVANWAEDQIAALRSNRARLKKTGVTGLSSDTLLKNRVKRIDDLEKKIIKAERDIERLEEKIEDLRLRRKMEAAKLDYRLQENLAILDQDADPEIYNEFI